RTHLTTHPDNTLTLTLADHNGTTIGHINTLTLRTITPDQLSAAQAAGQTVDSLYRVAWTTVPAPPAPAPVTGVDVLAVPAASTGD
ncbi:hypothetical protein, partial [Streptomyces sp. JWR5-1]